MKNNKCKYSKAFYTQETLAVAINDYKKIAIIKLLEDKGHYICEFSECLVDSQVVINEFNNYLIELMNSKGENIYI